MRSLPAVLALLLLSAACAHQARIESDPPGAEVIVNGDRVGLSPVEIPDEGGWKRSYEITLRKDGYEDKTVSITQAELNPAMVTAAAVCGACTLGLAALYFGPRTWNLDDRYRYVMTRKQPLPPVQDESAPAAPGTVVPQPAVPPPTTLETAPGKIRY